MKAIIHYAVTKKSNENERTIYICQVEKQLETNELGNLKDKH